MPAKKAPGESAAKPAASAPNPDTKPAEKRQAGGQRGAPRNQGQDKPQGSPSTERNNNNKDNKDNKDNSTDPKEAAIQRKINDLQNKITKYNSDLAKIKTDIDAEKKVFDDLKNQHKATINQTREGRKDDQYVSDQRRDNIDRIKELRRVKGLRKDEASKLKLKLPHIPPVDDSTAAQEAYVKKLDDDIRALERAMTGKALSLAEEKRQVESINTLQKSKKVYKEYVAIYEKINADNKIIKDLEAELEKTKESHNIAAEARRQHKETLNDLDAQIKASKAKSDALWESRDPILDAIAAVKEDVDKEWANLREYRNKRNLEKTAKMKQEWEERNKERAEREERRKAVQVERQKQEDLKIPYEDELYHCDSLVKYLESLLPPKPKEVAPVATSGTATTAPEAGDVTILKKEKLEDDFSSKKNAKKPKAVKATLELKHNVEVFLQFETVSLTPPSKVSDIEPSIKEVKAKKEHFQKLSEAAQKERQEKTAAAAEAAKSAESIPAATETPASDDVVASE